MAKKKKKKKKTSKKKTSKKSATGKQVKTKAAKATSKKKTAKKKTARKAAVKKSSKKKTARGGGKATAASMLKQPVTLTYDQIAARAFAVWERKGKPDGQDMANWREAEAELLAEAGA